jgi:hypothetical protein
MAKTKSEVNKSEEIRKLFAANPGATGKEIVAKLRAQGIEASEGLVYSCKPGKKKKGLKGKAKSTPSANGSLSIGASISVAKAAAQKVGSWMALKEIVDAMQ